MKQAIHITRSAVLLFAGLLPYSTIAYGESVAFQGRSFEVDRLELLPGDQATVEVGGQRILVSSQTIGQSVFRLYAEKPDLLPSRSIDAAYGSFVASLSADDGIAAIQGMLIAQGIDDNARGSFFEGVTSSKSGGELLVTALRRIGGSQRQAACIALPPLWPQSSTEVKKAISSDLSWMVKECPQKLVQIAQAELLRGDLDRGGRALSAVGDFFKGTSEISQAAASSSDRLKIVRESVASNNADQFESALRGASFDPLLREYYERSRGDTVAEFSVHALSLNQPATALRGLSVLDFSDRNDRHHDIMLRALRALSFKDGSVLGREPVRKMLWSYAAKDQEIKDEYLGMLTTFVNEAVRDGDPAQGALYFDMIRDLRGDPSLDNDDLRGLLAEGFVDVNDLKSADSMLHGVQTSIPWIVRFRLLLKLDRYALIMVLLGVVVLGRWAAKLVVKGRGQGPRESPKSKEQDPSTSKSEEREADKNFQGVDSDLKKSNYKGLDEYTDCLAKFGLKSDATVADIKNAYRAAVKSFHPDMNPNASKHDTSRFTSRFIELTKTYERLLVLHEERSKIEKSPDLI